MDAPGATKDWLAYQGAAYFRTSGALDQYGLSARGLAIDTAMPWPEEFPRFTQFWLEQTPADSSHILIYALMDSPSVDRRLSLRLGQAGRRGGRHPRRAVLPPGRRAHGGGAAHQHVLVRREQPPSGDRLAAGGPRQRRPGAVDRQRRADLAAAQQPAERAHELVHRREPQGLRAAPARPRVPQLRGRRRVLRPPAERLDRAARRLGRGRGAAGRDPDRRRDPRQHRRLLGAGRRRSRPARTGRSPIACTGWPTSPTRPRTSPGSGTPAWAAAAFPGSRGRKARASS